MREDPEPHNTDAIEQIKSKINPFAKRGIAKNLSEATKELEKINPLDRPHRIGIVCDDSGSMGGEAIINAHTAVSSFCANCKPKETSITIYPLNAASKQLICDYDVLTMYWNSIGATGGTPLYTTLKNMIEKESITRAVVFSDGGPTDGSLYRGGADEFDYDNTTIGTYDIPKQVVKAYKDKEIPIDTVFIGLEGSSGFNELQLLAKLTNGTFIHFKNSASLSAGLKYLSPAYRGLLANPEIKAKIERGEKV